MFDTLFLCRHVSTQKEALRFRWTFGAKPQMPTACYLTFPREGAAKSSNTTPHCFHLLPQVQFPSYLCNTGRMLHRATPHKKSVPPGGAAKHSFPHPFYLCAKRSSLKIYPIANLSLPCFIKKPFFSGRRECHLCPCTWEESIPEPNCLIREHFWKMESAYAF